MNKQHDGTDPDFAQFEEAIRDLVRMGHLRATGEIRNGFPVYVLTELGRRIAENGRATVSRNQRRS